MYLTSLPVVKIVIGGVKWPENAVTPVLYTL